MYSIKIWRGLILDEELEDEIEEERRWLKKEFGENDELFKALQKKLKKNLALQGKLKKKDNFLDELKEAYNNYKKKKL